MATTTDFPMEHIVPRYETHLCFAEMNPEEGAGDNGPEGAVGEEPVAMQVGDNRL